MLSRIITLISHHKIDFLRNLKLFSPITENKLLFNLYCIGNNNWGGINGPTCGGANQIMTVIFEYMPCEPLDSTVTYSWSPSSGLSDPNIANPVANPSTSTTYTVNVNDGGCIVSDSITIYVTPLVSDAGATQGICAGDTVQLSASSNLQGVTYSWSPGTNLSCTACPSPIGTPTDTTTYYVTGTVGTCTSVDSVTILVNSAPNTNAGPDQAMCNGTNVSLTASGGATYQWSPQSFLSCDTCSTTIANPPSSMMYYVTAMDSFGCFASDSIFVEVNGVGNLVISSTKDSICPGDTTQINLIGGCTSSNIQVGTGTLSSPTYGPFFGTYTDVHYQFLYSAAELTASGLVAGNINNVAFNVLSKVSTGQYENFQLSIGNTSTNCLVAGGGWLATIPVYGPVNYQTTLGWNTFTFNTPFYWDGISNIVIETCFDNPNGLGPGGSDAIEYASGFSCDMTMRYYTNTTNSNGCLLAPSFDYPNRANVQFACTENSLDSTSTFTWSPSIGLSDSNIANPVANPISTTTYTVNVNDGGCITIDTITIYVTPLVSDAGLTQGICAGDTVQLTASSNLQGVTYSWSPGTNLTCTACPSPIAFPTDTTTYYVTGTIGTCSSVDSVTILVNSAPIANAGPDQVICNGLDVVLSASGGFTYQWSPLSYLTCSTCDKAVVNPPQDMTYYVTVMDSFGCGATDSVFVEVNGQPITAQSTKSTVCSPGDTTQLFLTGGCSQTSAFQVGTGTLSGSSYGPFFGSYTDVHYQFLYTSTELTAAGLVAGNIDNVAFNVLTKLSTGQYENFQLSMGNTTASCLVASSGWLATTPVLGPINYTTTIGWNSFTFTTPFYWDGTSNIVIETCFDNPNGLGPGGSDNIEYTSGFGCDMTMRYYTNTTNSNGCLLTPSFDYPNRANVQFSCIASPLDSTMAFSWAPSSSLSDSTIINPIASPTSTTSYVVSANDQGCISTDTITIFMDSTVITAYSDINICIGGSTQLNVTSNTPVASYGWSPSAGLNNAAIANPIASPTTTTSYSVKVTNIFGCQNYDTVTVTVDVQPSAMFIHSSNGLTVQFTDTSTGSAGIWYWTFGDGGSDIIQNPQHIYTSPGTYQVCLFIQNACDSSVYCSNIIVDSLGCGNFTNIITSSNIMCSGINDGTASASPSGGIPPFTYLWDDPAAQTTATANGLSIGTYTVLITDSIGCIITDVVNISDSTSSTIILSTSMIATSCAGSCDGSATATVSSGNPPYSYLWNDPNAQTTPTAIGLCAGNLIVNVTDSIGCTISDTVSITEPTALSAVVTNVDTATQGLSDGSATVSVSGGTQPYTYLWDDPAGQITPTANGLAAGTYTCLVTDANGCTFTVIVTVPTSVGLWDMNLGIRFEIHPNPTDGLITIDIELLENSNITIEVIDILGNLAYNSSFTNIKTYKEETNLRKLAQGIYFVRISTKKGSIKKKIIITK